jgi:hypothetical protein
MELLYISSAIGLVALFRVEFFEDPVKCLYSMIPLLCLSRAAVHTVSFYLAKQVMIKLILNLHSILLPNIFQPTSKDTKLSNATISGLYGFASSFFGVVYLLILAILMGAPAFE